jgi:hypothetical protein
VLEQVHHRRQRSDVVSGDDVYVRALLFRSPDELAPDAPKTVDTDANGHVVAP